MYCVYNWRSLVAEGGREEMLVSSCGGEVCSEHGKSISSIGPFFACLSEAIC